MLIKAFVDEGLGNSSYLIGSDETGQAAVIDPQRDVDKYVQTAEGLGLQLVYALDTHLHNDFVSGVRELAAQVGLRIAASADAQLGFDHLPVRDGEGFRLGELSIGVLATPGHTPEHVSFTLAEPKRQQPSAVFTGGALIVGGVARTDLLGREHSLPLARQSYHTLHDKLLKLPDAVNVYPTHGAGSFCIAPASAERVTTIGRERLGNPLAHARSEEEFVERALTGLPSYPTYYRFMRVLNQRGAQVLGGVPQLPPLPPHAVQAAIEQGAAILDVRRVRAMAEGHVPGAYCIAVDAPLATWAGWLIPFGSPLILVSQAESDREQAVRQLIRIGYDAVRGYLQGGLEAWRSAGLPVERTPVMSVAELRERLSRGAAPLVLDTRQESEWQAGHIPGAVHVENGRLAVDDLPFDVEQPIALHCQHGPRAMAGISVLARRGYRNLTLVKGGFAAWAEAGYPVER
jgi:hydroxyacylglutathione hydrolase